MPKTPKSRSHLPALLALLAPTALATNAHADRVTVRIGGSASAGVHVNVGGDGAAVSAEVDAGLSFGVGFSEPPPPPPPPVPAYYVEYYEPPPPPPPAPAPVYVAAPAAPVRTAPAMQRWAIGGFAGAMVAGEDNEATDGGLFARYRLLRALTVEAEISETTFESERVDRRLGGALHYNLGSMRQPKLQPSILIGAGYGQSQFGRGELKARRGYGEMGLALAMRITRSIHLTADARFGTQTVHAEDNDVLHVSQGGSAADLVVEEEETYSRVRIGAMFVF